MASKEKRKDIRLNNLADLTKHLPSTPVEEEPPLRKPKIFKPKFNQNKLTEYQINIDDQYYDYLKALERKDYSKALLCIHSASMIESSNKKINSALKKLIAYLEQEPELLGRLSKKAKHLFRKIGNSPIYPNITCVENIKNTKVLKKAKKTVLTKSVLIPESSRPLSPRERQLDRIRSLQSPSRTPEIRPVLTLKGSIKLLINPSRTHKIRPVLTNKDSNTLEKEGDHLFQNNKFIEAQRLFIKAYQQSPCDALFQKIKIANQNYSPIPQEMISLSKSEDHISPDVFRQQEFRNPSENLYFRRAISVQGTERIEFLNQALKYNPNHYKSLIQKSIELLDLEKYEEASSLLKEAIIKHPEEGIAYFNFCILNLKVGKDKKTILIDLEKAQKKFLISKKLDLFHSSLALENSLKNCKTQERISESH
jgi:tetratricopeptide (TPR) repeat protein